MIKSKSYPGIIESGLHACIMSLLLELRSKDLELGGFQWTRSHPRRQPFGFDALNALGLTTSPHPLRLEAETSLAMCSCDVEHGIRALTVGLCNSRNRDGFRLTWQI